MKKGVLLYLEPGTRIRNWIRNQNLNVTVGRERVNGRLVRTLEIRGGNATFLPGGSVGIRMPGSDQLWVAFSSLKVLEIWDSRSGHLIKANHYLCPECYTLTGKVQSHKPSAAIAGREDAVFICHHCQHRWQKRI